MRHRPTSEHILPFKKLLINANKVAGTILGTGDTVVSKEDRQGSCLDATCITDQGSG